jgi:hypothetical protein
VNTNDLKKIIKNMEEAKYLSSKDKEPFAEELSREISNSLDKVKTLRDLWQPWESSEFEKVLMQEFPNNALMKLSVKESSKSTINLSLFKPDEPNMFHSTSNLNQIIKESNLSHLISINHYYNSSVWNTGYYSDFYLKIKPSIFKIKDNELRESIISFLDIILYI